MSARFQPRRVKLVIVKQDGYIAIRTSRTGDEYDELLALCWEDPETVATVAVIGDTLDLHTRLPVRTAVVTD